MKKRSSLLLCLLFISHSALLLASLTGLPYLETLQDQLTPPEKPSFSVFVISSEIQISKAKSIIDQAPKGLYITLGSERGFKAASMSSQISELLLLDLSPKIVRFNRINIALLKAPSLAAYKKLRWESDFDAWKETASELTHEDFDWWNTNVRDPKFHNYYALPELLNRYGRDILLDKFFKIYTTLNKLLEQLNIANQNVSKEDLFYAGSYTDWDSYGKTVQSSLDLTKEDWVWWRRYVGNGKRYSHAREWCKDINTAIDLGKIIDFKSGNYLYHEDLYLKLHQMALQKKIGTLLIDLRDKTQVALFVKQLKNSGLALSVLDLDNAYDDLYMGDQNYEYVVKQLLEVGQPNSILLAMRNYKAYGSGQFQTYIGFTFENVQGWSKGFHLQAFFNKLPTELGDLINGKLYEGSDTPPDQY